MDTATLVGILLGFGILIWAMTSGGVGIDAFIDVPSLAMVFGGTVAASLISFPMKRVIGVMRVIRKTFVYPLPEIQGEIDRMAEWAVLARREGLLALEEKIKEIDDPFLSKGIRLVVDGFPAQTVKDVLGIELYAMQQRHTNGRKLMDQLGALAPSFGMIGTLVGLVAMLKQLSDPSQIGGGMALALITTLYGAIFANLVFLPLGVKLESRQREETLLREVMIEGIACIQAGDKPQTIKEKLNSFVAPSQRDPDGKSAAAAEPAAAAK